MKLGLRKPRRKHPRRRHGDVPAAPHPVATAYERGHEIRVYETSAGRYYPVVAGAGTRAKLHGTIREAILEGRFLTERMTSRSAAYTRRSRATRRR